MTHTIIIDLDNEDMEILTDRFEYPYTIPDPSGTGPSDRRKRVNNPMPPEEYIERAIHGFVRRLIHEHIGHRAGQKAQQEAIKAYEERRKK